MRSAGLRAIATIAEGSGQQKQMIGPPFVQQLKTRMLHTPCKNGVIKIPESLYMVVGYSF